MKTKILLLIAAFTLNYVNAQESCMPESREDNSEINVQAAKALKFYMQDNKVRSSTKILAKKGKFNYMRHSFASQWKNTSNTLNEQGRAAYVVVGMKADTSCKTMVFYLRQKSLGAGQYAGIEVYDNATFDDHGSYSTGKSVDCSCIIKEKDYLQSE